MLPFHDRRQAVRVAIAELRRNMQALRRRAAVKFPGERFEHLDIKVVLGYESNPPKINIINANREEYRDPQIIESHVLRIVRERHSKGDLNATYLTIVHKGVDCTKMVVLLLLAHLDKSEHVSKVANSDGFSNQAGIDLDEEPLESWKHDVDDIIELVRAEAKTKHCSAFDQQHIKMTVQDYMDTKSTMPAAK